MDFTERVDLASERLGGVVLYANDEFFAPKENLLKNTKPIFIEGKYTEVGKWMDGWETRRRRTPGFDWCIIRLGLAGVLHGVIVDTSHFKGNYPEYCSIDACSLEGPVDVAALTDSSVPCVEILPKAPLQGDSENRFAIEYPSRVTHLRFKVYPDGGVARLRAYGEVIPDWSRIAGRGSEIDLAAIEHGGLVVGSSDMFFGSRQNLIMPGRAAGMSDGWETRRRRGPGHDWAIVKLGTRGTIRRVEVDTSHFKGNFPESCSLEACDIDPARTENIATAPLEWREILPRTKLEADTRHRYEKEIQPAGGLTHVRFNIFPDGGVSRLRIFGTIEKLNAGLDRLNALSMQEAEADLRKCCGSTHWARRMAQSRPFPSPEKLLEAADRVWREFGPKDWLEAFHSHPRIGEKASSNDSPQARRWSGAEQSGTRDARPNVLEKLAEANRTYEVRFGYIFIVCATGKSAEEMLALLEQRLQNDPGREIHVAAEEQRKITRLRLEKLLGGE